MTTGGSLSSYMYSTACHHSSHTPPETADTQCVAPRPRYPLWFVVFISQIHAYASSHDAGCHCAPAGGTAPPQFQQLDCRTSNTGAEAPSSVCQRRAESPSPGGGSGGALATALLLVRRHSCALLVATSRQAASRDQQPRGLRPASSSCCRRGAAEQARAAARVRVPGRPAGHARKRACQPLRLLVAALCQIATTTTFENLNNCFRGRRTDVCS